VEVHLVERFGQRFLAHPGLQDFDTGLVADDARFRGAGAQGVGELGGPPVVCISIIGLSSSGGQNDR